MKQLLKAKTPPLKWVIQVHTLSSQQQTTEVCTTLNFEPKRQLGDRTTVSPEDFEKLNIIISDCRQKESLLRQLDQGYACQLGLNLIKFIQFGGAA